MSSIDLIQPNPTPETDASVKHVNTRLDPNGLRINEVSVDDGYQRSSRDKLTRRLIQSTLDKYNDDLASNPNITIDSERNPARDYLDSIATVAAWKQMMPSAMALYPLQRPDERKLPEGTRVDALSRQLFRHSLDAIGIRTRAKIMERIAIDQIKSSDSEEVSWVSLACGAAVPVLDAMSTLREQDSDKNVHLTLVDYDPTALNFAEFLANKQGLVAEEDYTIEKANLIREMIVSDGFVKSHGEESFDMVDMLGIFEYFDKDMSAKMLQNAYRLVKPGGVLVLGNMLDTHRNLDLNQRAIGWPSIKPRSIDEITEILNQAGVPLESTEAFIPQDGVYAVVSIEKPVEADKSAPVVPLGRAALGIIK